MTRTILHLDMDAFYASVELIRHPELAGMPVAVGGTGRRGVVAAASYEARRYGVRSAMPTSTARRMCPDLVLLPGDHAHYGEVSATIFGLLGDVTPLVEPLSLDEAFLDVSGSLRLFGDGRTIANRLRATISEQLGLDCSVGVAPSKFLAKLASEAAKPRCTASGVERGAGVIEVRAGAELEFLHPLPVAALWGVGPATLAKLERLGVHTVGDLAALDERALVDALGTAAGTHLHRLAWADDPRPVEPDRPAKSISHEETFADDRHTVDELRHDLVRLADGVASRLRGGGHSARTFTLKVRFGDFTTVNRSTTVATPVSSAREIVAAVEPLLAGLDPTPGVRLLGVGGSNLAESAEQLDFGLGGDDIAGWRTAEATVDRIRERFGAAAIRRSGVAR